MTTRDHTVDGAEITPRSRTLPGRAGGPDQAGEVVVLEDWRSAADAAVALLSDPPRHAVTSTAARDRAVRLFSVTREAAAIGSVSEELWAGRLP